MQCWIRKAIRATILGFASWAASTGARADDELPPAPVAADEIARPKQFPLEDFEHLAPPPQQPSAAESPLQLLEESPEVQEFARRLSEKLQAEEKRKTGPSRSWRFDSSAYSLPAGRPTKSEKGALSGESCNGNCPICGAAVKSEGDVTLEKLGMRPRKPAAHWLFEDIDVGELRDEAADKGDAKLLPGEPAQVILELRERLGNSALEGSEFTVKPDALAKLIRALDREAQQEEPAPPAYPTPEETVPAPPAENAADHLAEISALRLASRQLEEAADVLEQQNLFERADELREQADRLRRDARAYLQDNSATQPAPASFEQSSAPKLIEQPVVQAVALQPVKGEFSSFLESSRRNRAGKRTNGKLTREFVDGVESFLDELAKIRNAIDEMVKPQALSAVYGGFSFVR